MIIRQLIFEAESNDIEIDWRTTARVTGRYVFLVAAVGIFIGLFIAALS